MTWLMAAAIAAGILRHFDAGIFLLTLVAVVGWRRWRAGGIVCALVCAVVMVSAMKRVAATRDDMHILASRGSGPQRVVGTVAGHPSVSHWGSSFPFRVTLASRDVRVLLRATCFDVTAGDTIAAVIKPVRPRHDLSTWLLSRNLSGIFRTAVIKDIRHGPTTPARLAGRVRACVRTTLTRLLGNDAGLPVALLIGDRGTIEPDDREAFRRSGAAHLLALSGMHLGIVVGIAWGLLRFTRRARFLTAVLVATAYVATAGAIPSLHRAYLMFLVLVAAQQLARPPSLSGAMARAALVIIAVHPWSLYSVGLQLSFLAMAGIAASTGPTMPLFRHPGRWRWVSRGAGVALTGAFVTVVSLPVLLEYFGRASLVGPVATLICLPLVTAVVLLSVLAIVCDMVTAPSLFSPVLGGVLGALRVATVAIGRLPADVSVSAPDLQLYYLGIAIAIAFPRRRIGVPIGAIVALGAFLL